MATKIYSGGTGQATSQNSLEALRIRYTLATPLIAPAGTFVQLSELIPESDNITIQYKTTRTGNQSIGTLVPLLFLAHVMALKKDEVMVYINSSAGAGEIKIDYVEFTLPVFRECKKFDSGNTLNLSLVLSAGASVDIWTIDSPFQSVDAVPYIYQSKTVLANNTEDVPQVETLYLPNESADFWQLQIVGNTMVQWSNEDFFGVMPETFITPYTPYQQSNYLGLGLNGLGAVKLAAGSSNILYFTVN